MIPRAHGHFSVAAVSRRDFRVLFALVFLVGLTLTIFQRFGDNSAPLRFWGSEERLARAQRQARQAEIDTRHTPLPDGPNVGAYEHSLTQQAPCETPSPADDGEHGYFPGVNGVALQRVKDNTLLRDAEYEAWFSLFEAAREAKTSVQKVRGTDLDVAALHSQSAFYRGKIVSLQGIVRRAVLRNAPANSIGLKHYYELWLWLGANVCIVCCEELPQKFPVGDKLAEPVEVEAIHFKRLAYQAVDDLRVAPLLVGLEPLWLKPPQKKSVDTTGPWWTVVLIAAPIAAAFAYWSWKGVGRGRPRHLPSRLPGAAELLAPKSVKVDSSPLHTSDPGSRIDASQDAGP